MPGDRLLSVHPLVPFKMQPFYSVLAQLVQPRRLTVTTDKLYQTKRFKFKFEAQHVKDIRASLTKNVGGTHEFRVQVHLRFRLLDASPEQEDSYPSDMAVVVNGRCIALPKPLQSEVPGSISGEVCLPINIVLCCFVSDRRVNTVIVDWCPLRGQEFAVGVFLVRKLSVTTLVAIMQHRRVHDTRAIVKQKLNLRACSYAVAIKRYHVSLLCPLSKTRMKVPCRAQSCAHLECFDVFNYLQINEDRPTWVCPVCGERAYYASLVIDQLFLDILKKEPGDFVLFQEDGSWTSSEEHQNCDSGPQLLR
ncbi:hypothetical protein HPB50_001276 [Hyalomma asiaticum]|uniref:Uncharacterized protein n=1 Tax=Hyalomma asiaticum TaxID=266040 RepID=A0ACB7RLT4_HYAAI|nr:hypothetical protein HPB50_001276 [Hyalomma asiaticum]